MSWGPPAIPCGAWSESSISTLCCTLQSCSQISRYTYWHTHIHLTCAIPLKQFCLFNFIDCLHLLYHVLMWSSVQLCLSFTSSESLGDFCKPYSLSFSQWKCSRCDLIRNSCCSLSVTISRKQTCQCQQSAETADSLFKIAFLFHETNVQGDLLVETLHPCYSLNQIYISSSKLTAQQSISLTAVKCNRCLTEFPNETMVVLWNEKGKEY